MCASIYIHIPFCQAKCDYCDFFSLSLEQYGGAYSAKGEALLDRYIERLRTELRGTLDAFTASAASSVRAGAGSFVIPSVYIGGGTPSLLGARRLAFLLDCFSGYGPPCAADAAVPGPAPAADGGERPEITLEMNPGFGPSRKDGDEALLDAARRGGVTRLSLGV
ncbi:MAG: hypothetical protein LBI85_07805, partial [Spirochaetaceae bacterium]|nr:hypothetical protein [Spirochaetaceae bacterium]